MYFCHLVPKFNFSSEGRCNSKSDPRCQEFFFSSNLYASKQKKDLSKFSYSNCIPQKTSPINLTHTILRSTSFTQMPQFLNWKSAHKVQWSTCNFLFWCFIDSKAISTRRSPHLLRKFVVLAAVMASHGSSVQSFARLGPCDAAINNLKKWFMCELGDVVLLGRCRCSEL